MQGRLVVLEDHDQRSGTKLARGELIHDLEPRVSSHGQSVRLDLFQTRSRMSSETSSSLCILQFNRLAAHIKSQSIEIGLSMTLEQSRARDVD